MRHNTLIISLIVSLVPTHVCCVLNVYRGSIIIDTAIDKLSELNYSDKLCDLHNLAKQTNNIEMMNHYNFQVFSFTVYQFSSLF